jgi:hypothetical protein
MSLEEGTKTAALAPRPVKVAKKKAAPKKAKRAVAKKAASKKAAPKKAKRAAPKKRVVKKAATKKAATKKAAAPKSAITNKAEFVRSNPTLSTKELVAKAKAAGVKLADAYIYNIRGAAKKNGKGKVVLSKTGRSKVEAASSGFSIRGATDIETLLYMVAAEIGVPRAIFLLQSSRASIVTALRGGNVEG